MDIQEFFSANHDKPPEWWAKQAYQYKTELDELNPKLNVAAAQVEKLKAELKLAENEKAALGATGVQLAEKVVQLDTALQMEKKRVETNAQEAVAAKELYSEESQAHATTKTRSEQRKAALQVLLAGHAQLTATASAAISED